MLGSILVVVFGLGFAALCIFGLILRALLGKSENEQSREEACLIQDMHHTLNRLEERVAVLETLLTERRSSRQES